MIPGSALTSSFKRAVAAPPPPPPPAEWTPANALFAAGEQGVWYDPPDLTRYMDVSASPELLPNGTFDSATGWTVSSGASISGGRTYFNTPGQAIERPISGLTVGQKYLFKVTFNNVPSNNGGMALLLTGGNFDAQFNGSGTDRTFVVTAAQTSGTFILYGPNVGTYSDTWIDNVSLRAIPLISQATMFKDAGETDPVTGVEQPVRRIRDRSGRGNHATAPSDAARPILRNLYNLLTQTENFTDAVWANGGATRTSNTHTDPLGGNTADSVLLAANGGAQFYTNAPSISGPTLQSIWLRSDAPVTIQYGSFDGSSFDTVSINVTTTWQRFTQTRSTGFTSGDRRACWMYNVFGTPATVQVWGASLVREADASLPYQRVTTATDYDSDASKFPLYLAMDSAKLLNTPTIPFGGTAIGTSVIGAMRFNPSVWVDIWDSNNFNDGYWAVGQSGSSAAPSQVNYAAAAYRVNGATLSPNTRGELFTRTASKNAVTTSTNLNHQNSAYRISGYQTGELDGRIYQIVMRGAATPDLSQLEAFVAAKSGIVVPALTWNTTEAAGNSWSLSSFNTAIQAPTNQYRSCRANSGKTSGKWYVEFYAEAVDASVAPIVGFASVEYSTSNVVGNSYHSIGFWDRSPGQFRSVAFTGGVIDTLSGGLVVGGVRHLAIDFDAGKIWAGRDGAWSWGGNPVSGATPAAEFSVGTTGALFPAITLITTVERWRIQGAETGTTYAPPAGFQRWT